MDGQQKRYSVTLNAPTTAVESIGAPSISYLDQDVVYHLSILDTTPSSNEPHQYHTVVRICVDDESQKPASRLSGPSENPANPHFCTIEYAPFPQQAASSTQIMPVLHSSLEKSFSVTWSSNAVTGGSYCLLPIKFRNVSCLGSYPLKLCTGTERIRVVDATVLCAEKYEESFACVRLFSDGAAQATRAAEVAQVEHKIKESQIALEQTTFELNKLMLALNDSAEALSGNRKAERRALQKRKASMETGSVAALIKERDNLTQKLSTAHQQLSSVRPVQVFRPVVSIQGEQPRFYMPSQQMKCLKTNSEVVRDNKGGKRSKKTKAARPNVVMGHEQSLSSTASAQGIGTRRPPSVACFYLRLEHLPNANYIAIYPTKQDFPSLLSGIAFKLQVHIGTIGTIYYYDQQGMPVVVNEKSISSLPHEQDLIVQLPCATNQSTEYSGEPDYPTQFTGDVSSSTPHGIFQGGQIIQNEQTTESSYAARFDQYLTLPPDHSYGASVDSWSDFTDDTSISMNQMFAQCSTTKTTMSSDDGMHCEADLFPHQRIISGHDVDHAGYAFDANHNVDIPTTCLSSATTSATLRLSAPSPQPQQALVQHTTSLQLSAIEEQLFTDSEHSLHEEITSAKPLPPGYNPPVSRKYATKGSKSPRNDKPTQHVKNGNGRSSMDTPKQIKTDKDVGSLERNRLAAMKCRLTRKEKEARLQKLTAEKAEVNADLKREIRRLEAQVAEARNLWEGHVGCV